MPRTFNDSLEEDLASVFFNTNEFGTTVSIKQGVYTTSDVAAIVAVRSYEWVDQGLPVSVECEDFDIIKSQYLVNGLAVEPRDGQRIINSEGSEFLVLPMVKGQCFETAGPDGKVLRVHTKRVL